MSADNPPSHHGVADDTHGEFPNETIKLLHERASCRSFLDNPIPEAVLRPVLQAGIHAPTGGNLQPYSIIEIHDPGNRAALARLCGNQPWIADAPVDLLFCIDFNRLARWAELEQAPFTLHSSFRFFWISFQDTIIAAQNICTAADAVGLGSVYIGTVLECFSDLKTMFNLPQAVFPVVLLCLGYPKARPQPRKKLGVEMMVHREAYTEPADDVLLAAFEEKYSGWKLEPTEERLATIEQVCRTVGGETMAKQCLARIAEKGFIGAVQNYFGLHYRADLMPEGNEQFVALMKEFGLNCFEPFVPPGERE